MQCEVAIFRARRVRHLVPPAFSRSLFLLFLGALAGACSPQNQVQRFANRVSEVDPRYGVRPSPRVVADGEDVPKGGGFNMVGKPYNIAGRTYYPSERPESAVGTASWYGSDFHGRRTANGEVFDRNSLSAAHPTMPLPSYARVTNLRNTRSIIVRVNDRGPYHGGRLMDVSQRVAEALDFHRFGTAKVKVEWVGHADLSGSDDEKLLATLRDDGTPAMLPGRQGAIMTAARQEPVHMASLESERLRGSDSGVQTKDDSDPEDAAPAKTAASPAPGKSASAPLPPSRPFDLGSAPTKRLKQAMK